MASHKRRARTESSAQRERIARRPPRPVDGRCALCRRSTPLTFHHLVPREVHDKRWARERFALEEMRTQGLWICRSCHHFLHRHFDEATLARQLNTLEALRAEPLVARHLHWARRQR